ncbi:MAG: hypothetical protein JRI68_31680 [Deltaproteobacteria bacterium]|nr:hypothetical protein [Deltaproteobacteria bacterium]
MWAPRTVVTAAAAVLLSQALCGCSKYYIPNTDVEDTDPNRRVVEFCEVYRKAVERKDIVTLLDLASPRYYEDGGNVDAEDDIDYAGLTDYLTEKFEDATGIRYEIRYRSVIQEDDYILVLYTYSGSYRLPTADGEKWKNTVEENRLELVPDGETFKIVTGM